MNHKAKCKRLNYKTHRSKHRNKSLWCWIRQWFLWYDAKGTRNNRDDWHLNFIRIKIFCTSKFNSVAQSCLTLWDPIDCSTPGLLLSITNSRNLLKLMSIESVMPSNHLNLCRPLLLLPSIIPSIRVFPNESVLRIRWSKYWSFSFSTSPSNEYSGLISFRMDWLDLLAV